VIVVDSNILAYLYLPTSQSTQAEALLKQSPSWVAPRLWRSEIRNVLASYLRSQNLTLAEATRIQSEAEHLMAGAEYEVRSKDVLVLAAGSRCSAYDCEFVALARQLGVPLVTEDRQIQAEFPSVAYSLGNAIHV